MRILLWLLLVALVMLVQSAAMVAARSANSELSKTSESRASMDQARALSATSLRGNGNDNVDEFEDPKGVSTEEERALLDQIARVTEKLIGPARMDALRRIMENVFFKMLRAGKMTPKQVSDKMMEVTARKGISDPVKIARIKNFSRNYGLDFVEKADDGTFKAMHEMGFGPRYFFKAVKQQTSVDDQKAYLAMAKRYRAWVENNNLKYY